MRNQADKKFTWVIKNFSSLGSDKMYSDIFVAGRCRWRLLVFPKGNNYYSDDTYFSVCLCVADSESLPSGWRRHTKLSLFMVNQKYGGSSQLRESENWFDQKNPTSGCLNMFLLDDFQNSLRGLMVNGEVMIVAEVDVLEVIGRSDVPEEIVGNIDVNGFQVPPSQVESVNSLFNKFPGVASKVRLKNPLLRQTYLNVVLSLTEILSRPPEELSNGDLVDAYSSLKCVTKAGFKLDWLEKKLKETGETRLQEIEEEIKDLKLKCADMEALLEFLR